MNALLFVASISSNRKVKKWCAVKRFRQYEAKWAKEKITAVTATDSLELTWD